MGGKKKVENIDELKGFYQNEDSSFSNSKFFH